MNRRCKSALDLGDIPLEVEQGNERFSSLVPRIYFPVALNIAGRRCVIVGGGAEAEFKARIFNQFAKAPDLIAEYFTPGLEELAVAGKVRLLRGQYRRELLDGAYVVLTCCEDRALNLQVADDARAAGALFNMVDNAEISDFIAASFVRKGNITVTILTDALSPAFANSLRDKISGMLNGGYQRHLEYFVRIKNRINGLTGDLRVKKQVWRELVERDLLGLLETDGEAAAESVVIETLERFLPAQTPSPTSGA